MKRIRILLTWLIAISLANASAEPGNYGDRGYESGPTSNSTSSSSSSTNETNSNYESNMESSRESDAMDANDGLGIGGWGDPGGGNPSGSYGGSSSSHDASTSGSGLDFGGWGDPSGGNPGGWGTSDISGFGIGQNTELGGNVDREASLAGIEKGFEVVGPTGRTASDDFAAGFYQGVYDSYVSNNLDPHSQNLSVGPTSGWANQNPSARAAYTTSDFFQAVDASYRAREIDVLTPGLISPDRLGAKLNTVFDPIQSLGILTGLHILGPREEIEKIADLTPTQLGLHYRDIDPSFGLLAGITMTVTDQNRAQMVATFAHELNHSGITALAGVVTAAERGSVVGGVHSVNGYSLSADKVSNAKTALSAIDYETAVVDKAFGVSLPSSITDAKAQAYMGRPEEVMSFLSEKDPAGLVGRLEAMGATRQEAQQFVADIQASPTFNAIDRALNDLATDVIGTGAYKGIEP